MIKRVFKCTAVALCVGVAGTLYSGYSNYNKVAKPFLPSSFYDHGPHGILNKRVWKTGLYHDYVFPTASFKLSMDMLNNSKLTVDESTDEVKKTFIRTEPMDRSTWAQYISKASAGSVLKVLRVTKIGSYNETYTFSLMGMSCSIEKNNIYTRKEQLSIATSLDKNDVVVSDFMGKDIMTVTMQMFVRGNKLKDRTYERPQVNPLRILLAPGVSDS